jgi:hypothetical protein
MNRAPEIFDAQNNSSDIFLLESKAAAGGAEVSDIRPLEGNCYAAFTVTQGNGKVENPWERWMISPKGLV